MSGRSSLVSSVPDLISDSESGEEDRSKKPTVSNRVQTTGSNLSSNHVCVNPCGFCRGDNHTSCDLDWGHNGPCACRAHRGLIRPGIHCNRQGVDLDQETVDPATQARYDHAIFLFDDWCRTHSWGDFRDYLTQYRKLDWCASRYVKDLFESYKGKSLASELLCALQVLEPPVRHHLPRSWRLIRAWEAKEPTQSREGWPMELALAVAMLAFRLRRPDVGLCVLLMYHCLLRPGEVCALRRHDIRGRVDLYCLDAVLGLISILKPKTRRRGAHIQYVTIENPGLLDLLDTFLASIFLGPNDTVFTLDGQKVSRLL